MCGIFAYTGTKEAAPLLLEGLTTLEYRGYDSAGLYTPTLGVVRSVGAVGILRKRVEERKGTSGTAGISHTRWATHGAPTETNAHPHQDCSGEITLVHNGIIENYRELRDVLIAKGHRFASETDSEVLAHLIEEHQKSQKGDTAFEDAIMEALKEVRGTFGIAVTSRADEGLIVTARMGSPIVIGIGEGEYFIASDSTPIMRHTKEVLYLNDGEMGVVSNAGYRVMTLARAPVERDTVELEGSVEAVQKGGYPHFMLKEIMESPRVIEDALRGRLLVTDGKAKLGGLESVRERLKDIDRVIIVGCGTAYYSGMVAEYMLEEHARIPVEVEIASEFRYRRPVLDSRTAVIAVSQSGETIDTLSALREGISQGALGLGVVNVVGSSVARETEAGVYTHAGPEISVASTKAFTSQLSVFALLTLLLGRQRGMTKEAGKMFASELAGIKEKVTTLLAREKNIHAVAKKYLPYTNFLFMGRKYSYPVAFEGALKLKEVSYVHAEGCGAGEMKHGPLAMIDETFPTIAIVPQDSVYEKTLSNIQEIKTRGGKVCAIATEGDEDIASLVDDVIYVPNTLECFTPVLSSIALQLFAYFVAAAGGKNVDRPRNLAKSVTVE